MHQPTDNDDGGHGGGNGGGATDVQTRARAEQRERHDERELAALSRKLGQLEHSHARDLRHASPVKVGPPERADLASNQRFGEARVRVDAVPDAATTGEPPARCAIDLFT